MACAGLSRAVSNEDEDYYRSSTGVFPVRWTAPDAMQSMKYSSATVRQLSAVGT